MVAKNKNISANVMNSDYSPMNCKICDRQISNNYYAECGCGNFIRLNGRLNGGRVIYTICINGFDLHWSNKIATLYKSINDSEGLYLGRQIINRYKIPQLTPKLAKKWLERLKIISLLA